MVASGDPSVIEFVRGHRDDERAEPKAPPKTRVIDEGNGRSIAASASTRSAARAAPAPTLAPPRARCAPDRSPGFDSARCTASRSVSGVSSAPRQANADARPVGACRVLRHVARVRHADAPRRPRPAPGRASRGRRGRPRARSRASCARRTPTRPAARWPAPPAVPTAAADSTSPARAPARSASPSSAARSSRWSGSWAVDGATSTSGSSPGGGSTSSYGGSQISGPTTWTCAGQRRGYSSSGNVPTMHSRCAEPAVEALNGPETELPPRVVELVSASTQAGLDRPARTHATAPGRRRCVAAARRTRTEGSRAR